MGLISVDSLFSDLNNALQQRSLKVWVLLDRLDVAFVDNHSLEENALRALIRAYGDIRNLDQLSLKIFLREDIWKRVTEKGLREASHLVRYVNYQLDQPALLNLIVKRLLNNDVLVRESRSIRTRCCKMLSCKKIFSTGSFLLKSSRDLKRQPPSNGSSRGAPMAQKKPHQGKLSTF